MSVFSISALDRLIESDRRSLAASTGNGSTGAEKKEKENPPAPQRGRRPLYVSYPYSSNTSSASTPPRPRSPSPNSYSPSPYVVNHKRRVPNGGGDSKRTSQQNGFQVAEKSSVSRPSGSEELVVSSSGKQNANSQDWPSNGSRGRNSEQAQDGPVLKEHSRSPQSSLTLQFQAKAVINGASTNGNSWYRKPESDEIHFDGGGGMAAAAAPEEKTKGKRVGSVERRDMSSRTNDPRGKKKLEERSAEEEGGSSSRVGNASSSSSISGASGTGSRTSSNSGAEEWFDASDGLPDYSSDDDSRRNSSSGPGPSPRGDSDLDTALQLKSEIQRRIAAEDAREALQHQRDGMAQMFSSAGISVPQSDLEDVKITKTDKVLGVSDSECQRLMVARYVAGAVATGAVRAEAEAELQTVLAEKSKEIARLKDKLQYYEVVNHEMSQRNQESIENARQSRRRRQRIQRFVVFGLSAAVCVGVSVAAIFHYAPWEHGSNVPVLSEGERPNPVSLEQVVDVQDLTPEN